VDGEQRWLAVGLAGGVLILAVAIRLSITPVRRLSASSQRERPHRQKGENMLTKAQQKAELEALAAMPDAQIDLSDIPEITDWSGAIRGAYKRPLTRHVSIRLSALDLAIANKLTAAKGLPYQTYIKSLLHEALAAEIRRSGEAVNR
jgi:predicted DNA binding CopG/RHH family protein